MASARVLRNVLIGLGIALLLVVILVLVLSRTEFGVERAGRFAVAEIDARVEGRLTVERVTSRGLLGGATLHQVAIDDPTGRPFLRADSARLKYSVLTLFRGSLAFDRLELFGPELYIEKLPGDTLWNYERVLTSAAPGPRAEGPGRDRLVLLDDVAVRNGLVVVRIPWQPDEPVERDDTARLILEPVPGGLARTLRFEDVDAELPQVLFESPTQEGRLFRIGRLSTRAYLWQRPAHVQELRGTVTVRDSLLTFEAPHVRLPDSRLSAFGRVIIAEPANRYDVQIEGQQVALSDLQWLLPALPAEGGGSLGFRIQSQQDGGILWLARDARVRAPGTDLSGSFGIVTGDTLYFTNVDLRAAPLNLELLRAVVPADLPLDGLLIGTVVLEGPLSALRTRGDVRLARRGAGARPVAEAVKWGGVVALGASAVRGSSLRAEVRQLDLDRIARYAPELGRIGGTVSGDLDLEGRLERRLDLRGSIRHTDRQGAASAVRGHGRLVRVQGRSSVDLQLEALPLALEAVAHRVPALARLVGEARGPIRLTGALDSLHVVARLSTPAGGLEADGALVLRNGRPRYAGSGRVRDFRLDAIVSDLPVTSLTGRFEAEGVGDRPETAVGRLDLELEPSRLAGVWIDGGLVRLSASDGQLQVDTFRVHGPAVVAEARGSFGLTRDDPATLRFDVALDSLDALRPLLFRDTLPLLVAADEPPLAGRLRLRGTASGTVRAFDVDGTASFERIRYQELEADYGSLRIAARDLGTPGATVEGRLLADSVRHQSRRLERIDVTAAYQDGRGHASARLRGLPGQEVSAAGQFDLRRHAAVVHLTELDLRTGQSRWRLAAPASIEAGRSGLALDTLRLERPEGNGWMHVEGRLPWRAARERGTEVANFRAQFEGLRVAELLRLAQADTSYDGMLAGRLEIEGTATAPTIRGSLSGAGVRYRSARLDRLHGELSYAGGLLHGGLRAWNGEREVVVAEGEIPLDLSLQHREQRRLDRPLRISVVTDAMPLSLLTVLVDGLRDVEGQVSGRLGAGGTALEPTLGGELTLSAGAATVPALGVRFRELDGRFAVGDSSRVAVALQGRSGNGDATVRGTISFVPLHDPAFDLTVQARRLPALKRKDIIAIADGRLHLGGRYARAVVSGDVRVPSGMLNLDELWRRRQIVQLELRYLDQVVDTSIVSVRPLLPASEGTFLKNLLVRNAAVGIGDDFWLRSQKLNVKLTGDLAVQLDRRTEDLRLTGTLTARRGTYDLQLAEYITTGRRFEIRGGTVEFVGTPGINPNLDLTAGYRVRTAQGQPLDVLAVLSGTLERPRVRLTSDVDPPISEADLASYLLFGRPTYALSQSETQLLGVNQLGFVSGVATPAFFGLGADLLKGAVTSIGIPLDYVAVSAAEIGARGQEANFFRSMQIEAGAYIFPDVFLSLSRRMATDDPNPGLLNNVGMRVEWRFDPTWTAEFFLEDRYAPRLAFGLEQFESDNFWGLILFREWGF